MNLIVRGLVVEGNELLSNMNRFFESNFQLHDKIIEAKRLSNDKNIIWVKTEDCTSKLSILKNKKARLKDQRIFIDNDLSEKERSIENKVREFARPERAKGKSVIVGFLKDQVDGKWFQ